MCIMLSKSNKNLIEIAGLGLSGDKEKLYALLEKIAVSEINKNHHEVYHALMELLETKERPPLGPSQVRNAIAMKNDYYVDVENIWLTPHLEKRVDRILQYFKKAEKAKEDPVLNKILLYGPPGTGKTTLGFYIAKKLGLPTRYVKVTDVMSSRLGETMKNISDVFHSSGKEVIFIDEFDAFAKTRLDNNDVGELKRIVNSIIQTLDFSAHNKIVIVATNLVETIDPAILRRFSFKIEVGILNEIDKKDFFTYFIKNGKNTKTALSDEEWSFLFDIFSLLGLNTVDELRGIVEKAKMEMSLSDRYKITYKDFIDVLLLDGYLSNLKTIRAQNKKLLAKLLREIEAAGYSKKMITSTLGIHRNTYPKYLS